MSVFQFKLAPLTSFQANHFSFLFFFFFPSRDYVRSLELNSFSLALSGSQHYAMAGLSTCLVIHTQDPTADYLLNCKIGTSPVICNNNLSAVRLETTKVCLFTSNISLTMSP